MWDDVQRLVTLLSPEAEVAAGGAARTREGVEESAGLVEPLVALVTLHPWFGDILVEVALEKVTLVAKLLGHWTHLGAVRRTGREDR